MEILTTIQICKDSHYKKSVAQTAAKVKPFPITYGCEFPEIKKRLWWGAGVGEIFAGFREQLSGRTGERDKKQNSVLKGDIKLRAQSIIFDLCQENNWRLVATHSLRENALATRERARYARTH